MKTENSVWVTEMQHVDLSKYSKLPLNKKYGSVTLMY